MGSFPKCITYISQVYYQSVNVRKPWKCFYFAADVHDLLLCDSPLNFEDLVVNAHCRVNARQTDGAQ